jgi:isocitrate dehydrogenase
MKEEDILLKKLGKENSFKVPDGYFENLTSEVMNKLPEKEKVVFKEESVSTWTRLKPLLYLAAMFVGASTDHKPAAIDEVAVTEVDTEVVSDEMLDVALDRAMLDDYSLYVYLSDASVE